MTEPTRPEAEVLSKDAGGRTRVHFAGLLRDAQQFVERNFPRPHVEPGSNQDMRADVFVRTSGGDYAVYLGEGSSEDGWHEADDTGNVVTNTAAVGGVDQEPTTPDNTTPDNTDLEVDV